MVTSMFSCLSLRGCKLPTNRRGVYNGLVRLITQPLREVERLGPYTLD